MSRVSRWIKEPFPGLSHALGALLSVAALVVLLNGASGAWQIVGFAIYGTTLILLFSASAATHSIRCSPRGEQWLDRFDYMAIYLLIAGTYTPMCLGPLRGPWGYTLLAIEWTLAIAGVIGALFINGRTGVPRIIMYMVMGWLALAAVVPLTRALPTAALIWLFTGGLLYSVGAVVFATDRPRLWPGRFVAHDLWHVMVLAGSACHFIVIWEFY